MKRRITTGFFILSVLITAVVLAQSSGGDFKITKSTIDNGGGAFVGGEYSLNGTIGQPDASSQISTGSKFVLAGGFWANAMIVDTIFKDSFESE